MGLYYDKEGNAISLMEWADLCEDRSYAKINETDIDQYQISTVWLGLNLSFFDDKLLIFETMIFCKDEKDELHLDMERYGTLEEAKIGHEKAINKIRGKMDLEKIKKIVDVLESLKDLSKYVESLEENDKEDDQMCPIAKELEKEYKDIMKWAFNSDFTNYGTSKGHAIEIWTSLHPDLPIPRVLKSRLTNATLNTISLVLDIIPLYHQDKKRKCKSCDNAS